MGNAGKLPAPKTLTPRADRRGFQDNIQTAPAENIQIPVFINWKIKQDEASLKWLGHCAVLKAHSEEDTREGLIELNKSETQNIVEILIE